MGYLKPKRIQVLPIAPDGHSVRKLAARSMDYSPPHLFGCLSGAALDTISLRCIQRNEELSRRYVLRLTTEYSKLQIPRVVFLYASPIRYAMRTPIMFRIYVSPVFPY